MVVRTGVLFQALPDTGLVSARVGDNGVIEPILPNRMVVFPKLSRALGQHGYGLWWPAKSLLKFPPEVTWLLNFIADPDEYSRGLRYLSQQLEHTNATVFNHPDAVLRSRRDMAPELLKDIPNLYVPNCVRFLADHPDAFLNTFKENGFEYPVMVRPQASQTGQHLVRIEGPDDWDKVHTVPWGGRHMFMTQFVDTSDKDGIYTKMRVVWAGGRVSLRHVLFSEEWLVHASKRTGERVKKELAMFKSVSKWTEVHDMANAVQKALGLDYFGIDVGLKPDGSFVLFEANAAMSIMSYANTPDVRKDDYLKNINRIGLDAQRAMEDKLGIKLA